MKKKSFFTKLLVFTIALVLFGGAIKCISVANDNVIVYALDEEEQERLERKKQEAIDEIRNYLNPEDYGEYEKNKIIKLMDSVCTKIRLIVEDENLIEYFKEEFYSQVQYYIGPIYDPGSTLGETKEGAINYIEDSLRNSEIYEVIKEEIDEFVNDIIESIRNATTDEEISSLVELFDSKMSKYPSNVDILLAKLRYDIRESFVHYIGDALQEHRNAIDDSTIDWLIEDLENKLMNCDTQEEMMEIFYYSVREVDGLINESTDKANLPTNTNVGLIVLCSVEGLIIVAMATFGVVYFLKKKKEIINKN